MKMSYTAQLTIKGHISFNINSFGGPHNIENSPLICRANQWTGSI